MPARTLIARRAVDLLALGLLALLVVPLAALAASTGPAALADALTHPLVAPALALSARTSALTVLLTLALGTPLAWRLARRRARIIEALVELPIVIPPAVVGVTLLQTFGRRGLFGPALAELGLAIPFTEAAVVLAQLVVAAPFFVQAAAAAFRDVDDDLLLVARTLGASPTRAFFEVAVPAAAPGLIAGVALCWARAIGEFGATLLFAGNLPGTTQTMPLAIYAALEADVDVARALALVLAATALALLIALRLVARRR
ncbi:MAG: molybdate ABC transporter permease subunit [bacterium]|nr:molybdate ABC transporter permease subunit [Myxococcales bacterium]